MQRKLAIFALCLILATGKSQLSSCALPEEFESEVMNFKDEVEGHYARKIQLNQVPEIVKRMIQKDPNVIERLKSETFTLA